MPDEPLVLGIETSCDETGVGIVRGHTLLADAIASSVEQHARFGGVVPEVASRAHLDQHRHLGSSADIVEPPERGRGLRLVIDRCHEHVVIEHRERDVRILLQRPVEVRRRHQLA